MLWAGKVMSRGEEFSRLKKDWSKEGLDPSLEKMYKKEGEERDCKRKQL